MKIKNAQELHSEAAVFRMWATLMLAGYSLAEAAAITVESIHGVFKAPLFVVSTKILGGALLWEALDGVDPFSDFIPYIAGKESKVSTDLGMSEPQRLMLMSLVLERKSRLVRTYASPVQIGEVMFYILLGTLYELECVTRRALQIAGDEYDLGLYPNPLAKGAIFGDTISESMGKITDKFTPRDCAYIAIGEHCASLIEPCRTLAQAKEQALLRLGQHPLGVKVQSQHFTENDLMHYELFVMLIESGMQIYPALQRIVTLAGKGNETPFAIAAKAMKDGNNPSEVFEGASFPPFVVSMLRHAELHGKLEIVFPLIVDYVRWDVLGIEPVYVESIPV